MNPPRIEVRRTDDDSQWYWRIVGSNGETMAHSETYVSYANAVRGAKTMLQWTARQVDLNIEAPTLDRDIDVPATEGGDS